MSIDYTNQDCLVDLRIRLLENGYEPIAVTTRNKNPVSDGWQARTITIERVVTETHSFPARGQSTGIRTGTVAAIDVDIIDPEHAELVIGVVEHELGATPLVRYGSKGAMLCYRNESEIGKIRIAEKVPEPQDGSAKPKPNAVEILGRGQQFVAFGIHPSGKEYRWRDQTPEGVSLADLPAVTPEQLQDLAILIRGVMDDLGYPMDDVRDKKLGESDYKDGGTFDQAHELTMMFFDHLPQRKKLTSGGWWHFHCPVCGDDHDPGYGKGGFIILPNGGFKFKCFRDSCEYNPTHPTGWEPGRNLGEREKTLYSRLGGNPDDLPRFATEWERHMDSEFDRIGRELADMDAEEERVATDSFEPEPEQPKTFKRFYSSAECRDVPAPQWQVKGLIPQNADVAIYGVSGSLKSFVALDLTLSIVLAMRAFGMLETKKPECAFYFAGEGFHNVIKKRQIAWQIHHGLEPYSTDGLWFVNGCPAINDPKAVEADIATMKDLLGDRDLGIFVIDTLSRSLNGGDEDKASTASQYFAMLKRIRDAFDGGTSITVGHFGKDTDRGERGSSNFRASYDTVIWIEDHTKDEETGIHTIQLYVSKQKDSDDGRRIWLQSLAINVPFHDEDDEHHNSLVLIPIAETDARASLAKGQKKERITADAQLVQDVEEALEVLIPEGGHVSNAELVNYLAERDNDSNISEDDMRVIKDSIRHKLKRARGELLNRFAYRETAWSRPLSDLSKAKAQQTISRINDIFQ